MRPEHASSTCARKERPSRHPPLRLRLLLRRRVRGREPGPQEPAAGRAAEADHRDLQLRGAAEGESESYVPLSAQGFDCSASTSGSFCFSVSCFSFS